jgi:hypothetical protein
MNLSAPIIGAVLIPAFGALFAADHPQAEISNGLVKAKLYLPDSAAGFYRGTRFDWSGVISNLEAGGHIYFGAWFKAHDPGIFDVAFVPALDGFAAGTPSAALGPVEEFTNPIGYEDAAAGGAFIKIGVGVLRKPQEPEYAWSTRYEIVDPGKWKVRKQPDSIEFQQEINGPSGYAYVYRKTISLSPGKPGMILEHSLKNTGRQAIETPVYNHNFLVMDDQPSGPDFVIKVPFEIQPARDSLGVLEVRGKEVVFARELVEDERAMITVAGFSGDSKDYDIRVENRKTGAGVRITADRPLARFVVWSVRPTRCPEPFINVRVEPGAEFTWRISYEFYPNGGQSRMPLK